MVVHNEKMKKVIANLKKLDIEIDDLTITTTLPSGKGGQKMQKIESAVRISYPKLEITVACQAYREKQTNLYTALCKLEQEAAKKLLGTKTAEEKRQEKVRKVKQRRRARSAKKYHPPTDDETTL